MGVDESVGIMELKAKNADDTNNEFSNLATEDSSVCEIVGKEKPTICEAIKESPIVESSTNSQESESSGNSDCSIKKFDCSKPEAEVVVIEDDTESESNSVSIQALSETQSTTTGNKAAAMIESENSKPEKPAELKSEESKETASVKPPIAKSQGPPLKRITRDAGFFSDPQPLAQQRLPLIAPLAPVTDSVDVPAYTCEEAKKLLKGKKIVYLGDSIQRASYKDLVLLLQENRFMTKSENRARAHRSILNDTLLDGGEFGQLTNDPHYKEVREFVKDGFHIKFFFITRIWYDYLEEVMKAIEELKPDVVIACSMLWDIMRYGDTFLKREYETNLDKFLTEIKKVVPDTSAIIWANSPPVADRCYGGVFVKQVMNKKPFLKDWHLEAMEITQNLVKKHEVDMMDFLGYLYPYQSQLVKDGLHWSSAAHRYMTNIILRHVCDLWEAEGAKLAEKAVTKLEDYKDIYDDPDDAYLSDMQHLFDQQAAEAGHYSLTPQVYNEYPHTVDRYSNAAPPPFRRGPPPPPDYYDQSYHYHSQYLPEDPMLRPASFHDPYYDPYGPVPARAPHFYDRAPMPPSRYPPPRPSAYYDRPGPCYYPSYNDGYDDVYGGLPDSYLMPSYRVGAGYANYPPRPAMSARYGPPMNRWVGDGTAQPPPFMRDPYSVARPLKRPMAAASELDPYAPVQKRASMEATATAVSRTVTPAEAAKLAQTSSTGSSSSSNYQKSFEERYGGPVGKPLFW